MEKTMVRTRAELERLPWFEKDETGANRLRSDMGIPPIIDIHAHVGWSYGINDPIDMTVRGPVRYFYNFDFDQDVLYDDTQHPNPTETKLVTRESLRGLVKIGPSSRTHTAANLAFEMDRVGYEHCCLLPIEIPFSTAHSTQTLAAAKLDTRLIPFAAVHPYPWSAKKEARLGELCAAGTPALKFHPEFQFIAPDNPHAMRLFAWCEAHDLPVLAHVGYKGVEPAWMRRKSEPERFRPVLDAYPKLQLLMAHTGIVRCDDVLKLAAEYPKQVWLDVSGRDVGVMEYILDRYDHERILYGSDWPFYPLDVMVARTLIATEGRDTLRERMFRGNARRFLGLD